MPIHSIAIFRLIKVLAECELATGDDYTTSALLSVFKMYEGGVCGEGFAPP